MVAFSYGYSLGRREAMASGATAGKDYFADEKLKKNHHVVESGSE